LTRRGRTFGRRSRGKDQQQETAHALEDAVCDMSFAFAICLFHPQAPIHAE
jgi:hypothetical protein